MDITSATPTKAAIANIQIWSPETGSIAATLCLERFDNCLLAQEVVRRYPGFNLQTVHWNR
ncbi:MAG TPA: hypothetical protein V6D10_07255 [Trichocoleus sp.]|jgi:hypothetical protein